MPSIYPFIHSVKINELLEQLSLVEKQLKIFDEFYGFDKLLKESQDLLNAKENIEDEAITASINKINDFIKLNLPVKDKIEQINYLMSIIEIYFDQNEIQTINSTLSIKKAKFKEFITNEFNDIEEIDKQIILTNSSLVDGMYKLFKRIKQTYLKKTWTPCYDSYLKSKLALIAHPKEGDQYAKVHFYFQQLFWLTDFLKHFENSYQQFSDLQNNFKFEENKYLNLKMNLIKSEAVDVSKDVVEQKIALLNEKFYKFNPNDNAYDFLSGLNELSIKLKELYQLNSQELKTHVIASKKNLAKYLDEKLSQPTTKCAQKKREKIKLINDKIDLLLLSLDIDQEDDVSSSEMANKISDPKKIFVDAKTTQDTADKISELKQTIKEANGCLSEYRGISWLRCFATLWGGGRATSQLLVNALEERLPDSQTNINVLPHNL